jgi:hypothetical protein
MAGNFGELVDRVREHYVEQFKDFVEKQKKTCIRAGAEVKLGGVEGVFKSSYCVDFLCNDGELKLIELAPDRYLSFDRLVADYGRMTLQVDDLRWDDIVIDHDLDVLPADAVETWFDRWHGPDNQKTNMIHSLLIEPRYISADLGTAPSEALFELISLLEKAGAKSLQIRAGRAKLLAH